MKKNEEQQVYNYSKNLGKLGGNVYENIISYNLCKRFYMEDIMYKQEEKSFTFNTNKSIDINELKKDIIEKLIPNNELSIKENREKTEVINDFSKQLNVFYSHQSDYDNIYKLTNDRLELNHQNSFPNNNIRTLNFSDTEKIKEIKYHIIVAMN